MVRVELSAELNALIRGRERKFEAKSVDPNTGVRLAHDFGFGCEPILLPDPNSSLRFILREDKVHQHARNSEIF